MVSSSGNSMKTVTATVVLVLILTILASTTLIGCGKRTTPIPRTHFSVDPKQSVVIARKATGVSIENNNEELFLVVYRTELNLTSPVPTNSYRKIKNLDPLTEFIDPNVVTGQYYEYAIVSMDIRTNTVSAPSYYRIKYSPMISLKNVTVTSSQNNTTILTFAQDENISEVDLLINNNERLVVRNNEAEIRIPLTGINSIVLTPYDKYSNPGAVYALNPSGGTRTVSQYSTITQLVVRSADRTLIIKWLPVNQATSYRVEIIHFGRSVVAKTSITPLVRINIGDYIDDKGCVDVKVIALKNGRQLDAKEQAFCLE